MGKVEKKTRDTPEQARVIRLPGGPARVLAGAGSGKTHTMAALVERHVRTGQTAPERILALTFTVRASDEMRRRLAANLGPQASKLTVSNFHRLAFTFARENAPALGLQPDTGVLRRGRAWLMVLDDLAADDLSLRRLDLSSPADVAEKVVKLLSGAKNELVGLEEIRKRTEEDLADPGAAGEMRACFEERLDLVKLAERFEQSRKEAGLLGYEDMVPAAIEVLEDSALGEAYRDRYDLVVVDEFQDTNPAQLRLVELLAGGEMSKVVVIGDDLQSIFGFQGAAIRNIQSFEERADLPVGEATYPLTTNFRSGRRILDFANHLARSVHPRSSPDEPKVLSPYPDAPEGEVLAFARTTDTEEAEEVARRIEEKVSSGESPASSAVLLRRWSQAAPVLDALSARGIPCEVVRGADLQSRPETRYLLDVLRLVCRPGSASDALLRALSREPFLLGEGDLRAVFEAGRGAWWALEDPALAAHLSEEGRARLGRLKEVLLSLEEELSLAGTLGEFVERASEVVGLGREVRSSNAAEAALAGGALRALSEVAGEFGEVVNLDDFLRYVEVSEEARATESIEPPAVEGDAVVVTTIHRAKGLEFDHVFVLGLSKGLFPSEGRVPPSPLKNAEVLPPSLKPDPDPEAKAAYDALDPEALGQALVREAEEEEGRLFYVAATRARRTLTLSRACYYAANKKARKAGRFWELSLNASRSCAVPEAGEPPVPETNPNRRELAACEKPPADPFPLQASQGSASEAAERLEVAGWEEGLERLRRDVRAIPQIERPQHILPAPEVHSPSSLMGFEVCPRRYYFTHVFPLPDLAERGEEARDYGTAFHAWIEGGLKGEPPGPGRPVPNGQRNLPGASFGETEYARRAASYPLYEGEEPPKTGPARMVEVPFAVEVGGSEVRGRMDAVFVDEDGTFHIIDWKSGKPSESYEERLQLPLYALAANRLWGVEPQRMRLAYVFHDGSKVEVEASAPGEIERRVEEVLESIRAGSFPAQPSRHACSYCPVVGIGLEGCPPEVPEE